MKKKNIKKTNKKPKQEKLEMHNKQQLTWIALTAALMAIGLMIFKYLPIYIFGNDILYDASYHVVFIILALYILWFFVDQKKSWRIPYFIFAGALIVIVSLQRIIAQQHNEFGIVLALLISVISIIIPRWKEFKGGIKF